MANAKCVLPTPPGPIRDRRRALPRSGSRRVRASLSSASRPISFLAGVGSWTRPGAPRPRCHSGSASSGVGLTEKAAFWKLARSTGLKPSASANTLTVRGCGWRRRPCSRALMAATLNAARSARASWLRPTRMRYARSRLPKARSLSAAVMRDCGTPTPVSLRSAARTRHRAL
jgi:hypothetical protein